MMKPKHINVPAPKAPVLPPNAHLGSDCRGVAPILARVGDKWSMFVIMLLGDGIASEAKQSRPYVPTLDCSLRSQ
jgi:DNA-binding HxlR family transcriptional regulator